MSIVKSYAVGHGDMFYIKHNSDNFTMIDCCLPDDRSKSIVDDLVNASAGKGITRFMSTHPDEDHLHGLRHLDQRMAILNFYCTANRVTKADETADFRHYCTLRDSDKAFYLSRGCQRRWMNQTSDERASAGLNIVWPILENEHYKEALLVAEAGGSPNNTSVVVKYGLKNGVRILWMGDLETAFMEKIANAIEWPKVDIVFASHHGRYSGKIPNTVLDQLSPEFIVLGEAPSRHLHYYGGYDTLTQNSAGDITFKCEGSKVHVYVSEYLYECSSGFLADESAYDTVIGHYIGTLTVETSK